LADNVIDTDKDIEKKAYKFKDYLVKYNLKNWFFISFLVLLLIVFITRIKTSFIDTIWNDEAVYMWNAVRLLMEPSYLFTTSFLNDAIIPQLIIAFFKLFTTTFNAGRLMALFYGIFGIVAVYFLGKEIKNEATGLIAAILLSFNHLYWFIGSKALIDVPIAAIIVFSAYCLLKFEKEQNKKWAIIAGISSILPVITKGVGSLVLFIFPIYFLITRHKNILKDKLGLLVLVFPVGILTVGNLVYYFIAGTFFTTKIFTLIFNFSGASTPYNFTLNLLSFVLNWWISPFLILGIVLSFIYRKREDILLLVFFFVYLLFTEFSLGRGTEVIPRFLLTVLPIAVVLVAKTFSEIIIYLKILTKIKLSIWIFVLLTILMVIPSINIATKSHFSDQRKFSFSGYQEAGAWLKENAAREALIYSTAPRQIRTFAEREYKRELYNKDLGGTTVYLSHFKTLDDFMNETKDKDNIYLHLDIFESGQPSWASPITQEKVTQLMTLGFTPVKEIVLPFNSQPVIVGLILYKQ